MRRYFMPEPPNAEYTERDRAQWPPDLKDNSGFAAQAKDNALARVPPGEPPNMYDVRCIYDSRPPNAYDFNLILEDSPAPHATQLALQVVVPNGYRAVVREWNVSFIPIPMATQVQVEFFPQSNNADVQNNAVFIGSGTTRPIQTFFVVDENATFGCRIVDAGGVLSGISTIVLVQVYGNLLPVTGVALPFEVTNRKL